MPILPAGNRPCRIANCACRVDRPSSCGMRVDILTRNVTTAHFQPEVDMPDPTKPVRRPWRRFLRLSVRGLIVLVLVIGVWLGWVVRSARIQREAVAAIEQAGGSVKYDWEWSNGKDVRGGKPWAPRLLVDLIGVDYFGHVTAVAFFELGRTKPSGLKVLNDTVIAQVGRLTELERLYLYASPTTEVGLGHRRNNVTDAGLVHLKGLTKLSVLDLRVAKITGTGLLHLKGLTRLSALDLSDTNITDAGMVHLKALTNLSYVGLGAHSGHRRWLGASEAAAQALRRERQAQ